MGVTGALLYGLYKLTNRNDETTTPEAKVLPPNVPLFQPDRHVQNASIIPDGAANITEAPRDVYIASRIIMGGRYDGAVGMIDKYGLGAVEAWATDGLSDAFNDVPSPFHHWCVVVGDYLHQLQSTSFSKGWNYYTNEEYSELQGWTKYKVGVTNFNDIAVRNAAEIAMNDTPEVYNVLSNNCQHYALRVLDKILRDGRRKVKMLNQTYGQMVEQRPVEFPRPTMIKIDDEGADVEEEQIVVPEEKAVVPEEKTQVVEEKTEVKIVEVEPVAVDDGDGDVAVDDENGDVAVVESEEDHQQMIDDAVAIMIQNTPSIKEALE